MEKQAPCSQLKGYGSMATKPSSLKAEINIVCNEKPAIQHRALSRWKTLEKFLVEP